MNVSIIIPAKNEASGLSILLPDLVEKYGDFEIIVVNDGSTDSTSEVCKKYNVKEVFHPVSKGNGASIKAGARAAAGDILLFMDGDAQHQASDISKLLKKMDEGFDMVVGARDSAGQAGWWRGLTNKFYNMFSGWIVGQKVGDLTSGFRCVKRDKFLQFLYLLPNGFSYPTTSTMAFFRAGYSVAYESIEVKQRVGKSHINLFKDGIRFLIIIFKLGTLYSPVKIFLPVSFCFFVSGLSYYLYTYWADGRFTNMGVLLFITSLLIFLMGLISEQITMLIYKELG